MSTEQPQQIPIVIQGQTPVNYQVLPQASAVYYPPLQDNTTAAVKSDSQAPIVINSAQVPRTSCTLYCPICKKNVVTVVQFENNSKLWIISAILYFFTYCLFFLVFLIKDLKDAVHYCPYCKREIGRNKK